MTEEKKINHYFVNSTLDGISIWITDTLKERFGYQPWQILLAMGICGFCIVALLGMLFPNGLYGICILLIVSNIFTLLEFWKSRRFTENAPKQIVEKIKKVQEKTKTNPNIVLVGARGQGKSALISSLYHILTTDDDAFQGDSSHGLKSYTKKYIRYPLTGLLVSDTMGISISDTSIPNISDTKFTKDEVKKKEEEFKKKLADIKGEFGVLTLLARCIAGMMPDGANLEEPAEIKYITKNAKKADYVIFVTKCQEFPLNLYTAFIQICKNLDVPMFVAFTERDKGPPNTKYLMNEDYASFTNSYRYEDGINYISSDPASSLSVLDMLLQIKGRLGNQ